MNTVGLNHFLTLSAIIFGIGLFGVFWGRKSLISILLSLELLFISININMVAFSVFLNDLVGQVFVIFILTVAAAEIAIGLAILVIYHRKRQTISIEDISAMRG